MDGVMSVCLMLDAMPKFPSGLVEPQIEDRRAIEKTVMAISKYDLDTIKAGMKRYYDQSETRCGDAGMKLYILNHYLFALPTTVRRDSQYTPIIFGLGAPVSGEITNPQPSDSIDARWPWSVDRKGEWHLTGTLRGIMVGLPYKPFEDFDYCRRHFGVLVQDQRVHTTDEKGQGFPQNSGEIEVK